jgi:hypothetical protein
MEVRSALSSSRFFQTRSNSRRRPQELIQRVPIDSSIAREHAFHLEDAASELERSLIDI